MLLSILSLGRVKRCSECGGRLRRTRARVLVDPRGVCFPRPVKALVCADCGRSFAAPAVWRARERFGARGLVAWEPVSSSPAGGP